MNLSLDWLRDAAAQVATASFAALPLALAVLAIDATIGRRLAVRYRCLLWTLVAIRLMLPVAPASPWSLQNAWRLAESTNTSLDAKLPNLKPPITSGGLTAADSVAVAAKPQAAMYAYSPAAVPVPDDSPSEWPAVVHNGIAAAWLAGAAVVLSRAFVASARFARRLRAVPVADDAAIRELLDYACDQLGVRRRPPVKYVPELSAPALFGVIRPTLCLPAASRDELDRIQLRLILLHELMHVRRRDAWLSWMTAAVQAVHWYNPVAWFVTRRIATYRELACDDAVRQFTSPDQRGIYTELLLRFAAARPTIRLGLVGMGFARPARNLKSRIEAFSRDEVKPRRFSRLAVWSLLGILAVAGFTDAATTTPPDEGPISISEWMSCSRTGAKSVTEQRVFEFVTTPGAIDSPLGTAEDGPSEQRTYDVTAAIAQFAANDPDADPLQWLTAYLPAPGSNPKLSRPELNQSDAGKSHFSVRLTAREHEAFADILDALGRSGPWQATVEARVFAAEDIDQLPGIDWQQAVQFAQPGAENLPAWPRSERDAATSSAVVASVESISWQYMPFVAAVVDAKTIERLAEQAKRNRRQLNPPCPKVTLFNGQRASVRDEVYRPFVVGVHHIKGELATAAQPDVIALTEGTRLDVQPLVVDAESLDLQCRLTVTGIEGVSEVKLPGQDVTVQAPRATRHSIDARCRMKPGQTLLIAPAAANVEGEAAKKQRNLYFAVTAKWFPDTLNGPREAK